MAGHQFFRDWLGDGRLAEKIAAAQRRDAQACKRQSHAEPRGALALGRSGMCCVGWQVLPYPLGKGGGCTGIAGMPLQQLPYRALLHAFTPALGTLGYMPFDIQSLGQAQFVVDIGGKQVLYRLMVHHASRSM